MDIVRAFLIVALLLFLGATNTSRGCVQASYSQSTIQYSPSGSVQQVEYAKQAVRARGGAVICVRSEDKKRILVVAIAEPAIIEGNKKSQVTVESYNRGKVYFVDEDESLILCVTGLGSDGNALFETSKHIYREYRSSYGCTIPPKVLASRLAEILHSQTRLRGSRPLAISAAIAGFDEDTQEAQLYSVNSEGGYFSHHACFLGGGNWMKAGGWKSESDCLELIKSGFEGTYFDNRIEGDGQTASVLKRLLGHMQSRFVPGCAASDDEKRGSDDEPATHLMEHLRVKVGSVVGSNPAKIVWKNVEAGLGS